MSINYPYPPATPPAPPKRRNTALIVTIIATALVLCCCIVVAIVIVFADPFNLHIKDRLFGGTFDAAAKAMPEDTGFYVGINLLGATPSDLDRVIQPFADALKVDQRSWDDLIAEIDKFLTEQLNFNLTDDMKPWIGQYAGLGIFEIRQDDSNFPASLVLAIESRNNNAADDFLRKFRDSIEKSSQQNITESVYQGVTIFTLPPENDGTGIAFCRSGSLVLMSLQENDLQAAIDAQKGRSLADNRAYRDLIGKMPSKRVATIYLTSQELESIYNLLQQQTESVYDDISKSLGTAGSLAQSSISNINIDQWDSTILSLGVTGAGIQLDWAVSYNLDNLSSTQREMLESMGKSSKAIDRYPEDTVAFLSSQRLDLAYDSVIQALHDLSPEASTSIDNALQEVRDSTSIDLEEDLIHLLDGEFALGVFPSSEGILHTQGNIDLGFALLAESSDTGRLTNTMNTFASKVEEQGAGIERSESEDLTVIDYLQGPGGDTVFASGVDTKYLSIASSGSIIKDLFTGRTSLSKSTRYRDAISPLPDGFTPVLYLDVEGILGIVRESLTSSSRENFDQSVQILTPIPYVVLGFSGLNGNLVRMTLIIHVK